MVKHKTGALLGTRRAEIVQEGDQFYVELFEDGHFVDKVLPNEPVRADTLQFRKSLAVALADAWVNGEYRFLQE